MVVQQNERDGTYLSSSKGYNKENINAEMVSERKGERAEKGWIR